VVLQLRYVTVASRFIKGATLRGDGSLQQKVAGAGYKQVRSPIRAAHVGIPACCLLAFISRTRPDNPGSCWGELVMVQHCPEWLYSSGEKNRSNGICLKPSAMQYLQDVAFDHPRCSA
jgi:hypothetical protein